MITQGIDFLIIILVIGLVNRSIWWHYVTTCFYWHCCCIYI